MKLENYKRGDNVYLYSSDKRNKSYECVVSSAGSKYVTVGRLKFDTETGYCVDWSSYHLFHSKDECDAYLRTEEQCSLFRKLADGNKFTIEEITHFMDYHNKYIAENK